MSILLLSVYLDYLHFLQPSETLLQHTKFAAIQTILEYFTAIFNSLHALSTFGPTTNIEICHSDILDI